MPLAARLAPLLALLFVARAAAAAPQRPAPAAASPAPPLPASPPPASGAAAPAPVRSELAADFNVCFKAPADKRMRLTFAPETEITDVIAWISGITCRPFIVPAGLALAGRKVTVLSPEPITPPEAYRLFLALLDSVGLTFEANGKSYRIIEAAKAARAQLPLVLPGGIPPRDDGYVTRLLRLSHLDATEAAGILQSFRGEHGSVVAHAPTRVLIVTDRAGTIERMRALLAELDVAGETHKLFTIPARHLPPAELAEALVAVADLPAGALVRSTPGKRPTGGPAAAAPAGAAERGAGGVARILPDDRGGRLLVVATELAFARLVAIAKTLDAPPAGEAASMHVYRCRHADCDAVGAILGNVTGAQVSRGPAPEGGGGRGARAVPAAAAPAAATGGAKAERGPVFQGDVRITSDPSTNSILVVSSLEDFRALRRLVDEIDVPRKQVFVEATIMEILHGKERKVGVGYLGGRALSEGGAALAGFEARNLLLDPTSLGAALSGLSGLAVGAPLDGVARALGIPSGQVPSLGAFINLLQEDRDVSLVANPHLLITNNHEGTLSVGERVPFQAAFASVGAPGAGSLAPVVSINREDVALTIKLTPHVNEENLIRLDIDQEMSEVGAAGTFGPTTTRRTAQTTVFAQDQQTIVIGGLMRDKATETVKKVPLLGDIPVLGFFFRSKDRRVEKQNIIIALTPYVIDEPADLARVLEAKIRDRREYVRHFGTEEERKLERRLLDGPLERTGTTGMFERINRAVQERLAEAPPAPRAAAAESSQAGLDLPGS